MLALLFDFGLMDHDFKSSPEHFTTFMFHHCSLYVPCVQSQCNAELAQFSQPYEQKLSPKTDASFLALLDCVSRAIMPWCRHPSSVRKRHFLRNRQVNYYQILWKGSYPPYLQNSFFHFSNFGFLNFNFFHFHYHCTLWE